MAANKSCRRSKNGDAWDDIVVDLYPFIRKYKDGHHERFLRSTFVAASEDAAANRGVATRDVVIDDHGTGVSARLFLPSRAAATGRRLPLVMYIHGGSFCSESAFGRTYHCYATSLAASSGALVVSVEYRLAPENPIPAAYDDAWAALRWMASLSDPWLADHADPGRTFLVGDSAGGNIAYHTAVRASKCHEQEDSRVVIEGLVMVQPYFWGADRLPSETDSDDVVFPAYGVDRLWPFVTAGDAGNDDPRINPTDEEIASLRCKRVLVAVAERDTLRDRGCRLAARVRHHCPSVGDNVTLAESEGEDHSFHLHSPLRATSKRLMERVVQFINQPAAAAVVSPPIVVLPDQMHAEILDGGETDSSAQQSMFGVPTRPFQDVFGYRQMLMKFSHGLTSAACTSTSLKIAQGKPRRRRYGLFLGRPMPSTMAYKNPVSVAAASSVVLQCSMLNGFF
uniref:Uncharacterized protein n=1 Tax=Avena sativa TaxID=4498 RepID=A0ACD5YDD0_AVESA